MPAKSSAPTDWFMPDDTIMHRAYEEVRRYHSNETDFVALIATLMHRIERLEQQTQIPVRNCCEYDEIDRAIESERRDA